MALNEILLVVIALSAFYGACEVQKIHDLLENKLTSIEDNISSI